MGDTYVQISYGANGSYKSVVLPVNPEEVRVQLRSGSGSAVVVGVGEVPIKSEAQLAGLVIETFIPTDPDSSFNSIDSDKTHAGDTDFWRDLFTEFLRNSKKYAISLQVIGITAKGVIDIDMDVYVSGFDYAWVGGSSDMLITVEFKQDIDLLIKKSKVKKSSSTSSSKSSSKSTNKSSAVKSSNKKKKIQVGSKVTVTGYLYKDSYGTGRGQMETKTTRKISIISSGRKCPYHVTTLSGGARGWVAASSVKLS
jgi:hypothetical protein